MSGPFFVENAPTVTAIGNKANLNEQISLNI